MAGPSQHSVLRTARPDKFLGKGQLVDLKGRLQTRQWDDDAGKRHCWQSATVGSSTLTIRFRVYAFCDLSAGRYPAAISEINGTGLAAPVLYADRSAGPERTRPRVRLV